ncbi:HK97 gp10 family phage protein [Pseudonocardia sp. ICBG601]|uniref:HK97 gp10 family phage protein n=1 Tax=Pseudonocardia sp. ICBG601 TaxID=2846759 RepID=UPI001CF6580D|nr:HK97 gp10 family phage protein [Pseudonocardia sp. ICBG601]
MDLSQVLNSDRLERELAAVARRIARSAQASAPRRTGALAGSVDVSTERNSGTTRDRVVAHVTVSAPYAASVEFGTSRMRGSFWLRRTAQSA